MRVSSHAALRHLHTTCPQKSSACAMPTEQQVPLRGSANDLCTSRLEADLSGGYSALTLISSRACNRNELGSGGPARRLWQSRQFYMRVCSRRQCHASTGRSTFWADEGSSSRSMYTLKGGFESYVLL